MRNRRGLDSDLEVGVFRLGDLEIGKIFDERELIIGRDIETMTTVCNDRGFEEGREYDIRLFMYGVKGDGVMVSVTCNGHAEVFLDDTFHQEYKSRLEQAGLWGENENA